MQLGAHESILDGLHKAVYRGQQATCDAIQLFTKSNNQWKARKLGADDIDPYYAAIDETGVQVACAHTSYLINIASPDRSLQARSLRSLTEEMRRCQLLRIPNLVLHPGSHMGSGEKVGMDRVARNIDKLYSRLGDCPVTLCLETTAGQGNHLGYEFEQLAYMIERADVPGRLGVCLDTCHVFAAGYSITERSDYLRTVRQLDRTVGLERLRVIHLNDSKTPFHARRDRHEHIGAGQIGLTAFEHVVNDRRLKRVPMVIETPKGDDLAEDIENLRVLRGLIHRRESGRRASTKRARQSRA